MQPVAWHGSTARQSACSVRCVRAAGTAVHTKRIRWRAVLLPSAGFGAQRSMHTHLPSHF
jgi:hypothetical protein